MLKVMEFRARIKELKDSGTALLNKSEAEKRGFSPEEQQQFDSITTQIDTLEAQMDNYIKVNKISEEELRSSGRPLVKRETPGGPVITERATTMLAKDLSYRGMFYGGDKTRELDRGEFKSLDEFFSVVGSGRFDERLEKRTMTVGVPTTGGFSVPEQFASEWLDGALENEVIRPRARVYPMRSETLKVPGWDDLDHSTGAVFGGFTIAWIAEGGTATRQTPKVRQIALTARKGGIYVAASREMAQDGVNFDSQLSTALKKGLGWGMDNAFINGTGAGQPLGIINAASTITIAKETGQTADTINYENLRKMEGRLHASCVVNAVWLANPDCRAELYNLTRPVGTGGTALTALTRQGDQWYLLDRPIYWTEKCPAIGDLGDIILADLSKYAIGLRQDLQIDVSNAPGWVTDTVDYRVIVRVDGLPVWDKAFTPKSGATQSWALILAAR